MTLYNRIRPTTFEGVIGNSAAKKMLTAFAAESNRPHVYLFHGASGCGKTTLARIFASKINADAEIHEVNAASNRGIDTAREIHMEMQYIPTSGTKVYILDEAHRQTRDFQEAMLKSLEDTPLHTYFFICTTEPDKLIKALRNRCTEIAVESVDATLLYKHIVRTAKAEGIAITPEVAQEIANASQGSTRRALVYLEQVAHIEDPQERLKVLKLGEESERQTIDLARALAGGKPWASVAAILKELSGEDEERIRRAVLGYMNSVLLNAQGTQAFNAAKCIECFSEPFYNSGKAGLALAAYQTIEGE